ncbi:SDR family NAD(P)-dependent oxidoreductase [Xanthobacter agilis]|uniref:SDR family NAD(P)-dependent oxidoreductase n=1 Tax=Xanthobacter agilis TaxID=47492 RepID=UPI00372A5E93
MLLEDKVAIVTGAASTRGIGWATAKLFADQGARIALFDLKAETAEAAAAAIGPAHRGLACDVSDADACEAAVARVLAEFGRVDILINNAGVSQPLRLMDSTAADWDVVMNSSLRGSYHMSRAVVPHMRWRRTGAIVCMGSVAAQRGGGVLGGPHYAAAKGGVQTLAKAMARELAPDGIRVNAVAPGLVDTELLVGKISDEGKEAVARSTPLGRLAVPLDIANACLYLASDLASYVTGVVIDVNGGLHIH